jgi:hypothetical protein
LLLQLLLSVFVVIPQRGEETAVAPALYSTPKTLVISTEVVRSYRTTQRRDPRISSFTRSRLHTKHPKT